MADPRDIPRDQLREMISAQAGVVTALLNRDQLAANEQLTAMIKDHIDASNGDTTQFAFRMLKQIEADARVTVQTMRTLAKLAGIDDTKANEILAQAWLRVDED